MFRMVRTIVILAALFAVFFAFVPNAMPAQHQEILTLAVPPTDHEIRVRFWSPGETTSKALAAITGSQSRDLGKDLRVAARAGRLKPEPGRYVFRIEFVNLLFEQVRGKTIRINGKDYLVPNEFGTVGAGSTIPVEVTGGVGSVIIKKVWVPDDAVIRIHLPPEIASAHYPPPPHRRLDTCSKDEVEGGRCGKWPNMKASEFANLVREEDIANYHFVR